MAETFEDLGVAPELIAGTEALGWERPSALQEAAAPVIRRGNNVGVVVDTHVKRIANRFGLTKEKKNTAKIEKDLMALFPRESWTDLSHLLIFHGRNACKARFSEPPDHPLCKKYGIHCE
ncbi:MAG TPA: hypothetical protein VK966_11775, partial [Longimicrobiales bacterium]|nr:hypothetical protein [Longimicrobiales bacterium]